MTTFEIELERDKADKIKEVASRGAAKAAELGYDGEAIRGFLRHYFRHVDALDVDERSVEELLGLVTSHYELAMQPPVRPRHHRDPHPGPVRRRLDERGDRGPDRHRRPTVPGRLGDDGGAPPGLEHPRGVPPPVPRRPRPRRHPARHPAPRPGRLRRAAPRHRRAAGARGGRVLDAPGDPAAERPGSPRPADRRARAGTARGPPAGRGGGRGLGQDAAPGAGDRRDAHGTRTLPADRRTEADTAAELLDWLAQNHFTFLGYREYRYQPADAATDTPARYVSVPATGLGILRADVDQPGSFHALPVLERPQLMVITKDNHKSRVHRPAYLDYLGIRLLDADGNVIGERRFLGLFASTAYSEAVGRIPLLRQKAQEVLRRSRYDESSHGGKAIMDVLDTYPRDELFQAPIDELAPAVEKVAHLKERRQVRLFVRRDAYGRYLSCLVYLPRDRYTTAVRNKMQDILLDRVGGSTIDFTARVTESVLARLHFVVAMPEGATVGEVDVRALERELTLATRSWNDGFAELLSGAENPDVLATHDGVAAGGLQGGLPAPPGDPGSAGADEPVRAGRHGDGHVPPRPGRRRRRSAVQDLPLVGDAVAVQDPAAPVAARGRRRGRAPVRAHGRPTTSAPSSTTSGSSCPAVARRSRSAGTPRPATSSWTRSPPPTAVAASPTGSTPW